MNVSNALSRTRRWYKSVAPLIVALSVCGCATHIRDTGWTPAAYSFGAANRLALTQLSGKVKWRDPFLDALRREVQQTKWWQFEDRRGADSNKDEPETGEVRVQIQIYDLDLDKRYDPKLVPAKDKAPSDLELAAKWEGRVTFAVTAVDPDGREIMRDREYTATEDAEDVVGAGDRLKQQLLREAIGTFLDDITPREEPRLLRVDEKSDDMKPVAELIRERRYHSAREALEKMRRVQPHRPDVLYNIGVVHQGMGEYDEALDFYNRAIRNGPKDYYHQTRDHCIDRLEAIEELNL